MTSAPQTDPRRPCWLVGATFNQTDDQTPRFLKQGIWENGHKDKFLDKVKTMRPGDHIAIKAIFSQRRDLPFPNPREHTVGGMCIKAIGVVTENRGDGIRIKVEWTPVSPQRRWYFSQFRYTVNKIVPGASWETDNLIGFTFNNNPQDINRFRNSPKYREKFGDPNVPQNPVTESNDNDTADDDSPASYSIESIIAEGCFLEPSRLEDIVEHWRSKKNLILQGPPGTGKTWLARKLAYALIGQKNKSQVQVVQFHPNLSYEDFVRGYRPSGDGKLALVDGPFLNMADAARQHPKRNYVIVIEEINRGNPAQVFGEMLTLLESDKRKKSEELSLSYRKSSAERVYIPDNLYVIGTMNIADRSLTLVDLAFRRRFAFEELEPELGQAWREWVRDNCGIEDEFLDKVHRKMLSLNQQIADDRSLGRQFRVGHSYVTPPPGNIPNAAAWFRRVVEKEIAPLLREYWFDSPNTAQEAITALLDELR